MLRFLLFFFLFQIIPFVSVYFSLFHQTNRSIVTIERYQSMHEDNSYIISLALLSIFQAGVQDELKLVSINR